MKFHCPLCCNQVFNSKQSLIEHLSNVAFNVVCPLCADKFASVEHLVKHLSTDNCEATVSLHSTSLGDNLEATEDASNVLSSEGVNNSLVSGNQNCDRNDLEEEIETNTVKISPGGNIDTNKLYMELLNKQLLKPCLETQELKLVMEDGENRYVVVSNETAQNFSTENTVVTRQNNDGTISLSVKEPTKQELNSALECNTENGELEQADMDENQMEIYSCNTCGVSFTSLIEHIQNYHNDQDVVVAESLTTNGNNTAPLEFEETENVEDPIATTTDKVTVRRMITETGDIVETPLVLKHEASEELAITSDEMNDTAAKQGQGKVKKYVQIEKFCNSVVKNINEDEKGGPYHKVVLKELMTSAGTKINIYNCISCNIYVPTIDEFKSRPCKILKYPCPHCPVAYENSKSLCAHMKVHKTKPEVFAPKPGTFEFECGICSTVFPTSKSLKLHKRMHDPIKSRPIDPPIETKLGTPVSEDKYLCVICNKLIPVDYKTIHQNSHKNSNKINCRICNKKFNSKEYLEMHMGVHTVDKVVVGKQDKVLPYNCVYCNRQFARPHEKVKHERIHTGEKPHSCEICGKSFRVSYCLTLHMRTHTGARPYPCHHCGKRFKAHSVYNHHLLTHSEVRAYKCSFCPKAFKTAVQLAGHRNSHTKPFSCQQCNRPFASLYAVRVHMDSHAKQNSLKFSCTLCGASYARAFALKDHVRTAHKADMDAADALSGLKEEEWLIQDEDEESMQPLHRDLSDEINGIEMGAVDPLIVP